MAAAIQLASAGVEVDVFEQAAVPGGKAATRSLGGYRFDTGPSLVTMPFVFERLFREAGSRLEDFLELVPLEPLTANFFADGTVLRDSSDRGKMAEALAVASMGNRDLLDRYLDHGKRLYDATAHLFLFQSFAEAIRRGGLGLRDLAALTHLDAIRSLHRAHAGFFRDPRLIQLFDRYATYNGSDPYRAPATIAIIPAVEYGFGGFTARGGIIAIPRAYESLARQLGVRFHLKTRVDRILVKAGRATGIRSGGRDIDADAVVTNADVLATYRHLLPDVHDRLSRRYERLQPSTSGLVFLWGIKAAFPELSVSNVFFSSDYQAEFEDLFTRRRCRRIQRCS